MTLTKGEVNYCDLRWSQSSASVSADIGLCGSVTPVREVHILLHMIDKVTTAKRITKDFYSPEHRNITSHQKGFGFPPKQNHQSWNKIHFKAVRLEVGLQMLKYYFIKWPEITSVWVSLKLAKQRTVGRISECQEPERSEVGDQEGKTKQAQSCDRLAPETIWRTSCFHRYPEYRGPLWTQKVKCQQ